MGARLWFVWGAIACAEADPVSSVLDLSPGEAAPVPVATAAVGDQTELPAAAPDCTLAVDGSWPEAWTACDGDEDCAEVTLNRCPCSAGGALFPIALEYTGCVAGALPAGHVCPQVYLCDDLVPLCDDGVCVRQ